MTFELDAPSIANSAKPQNKHGYIYQATEKLGVATC